jgi:hypothetical protein
MQIDAFNEMYFFFIRWMITFGRFKYQLLCIDVVNDNNQVCIRIYFFFWSKQHSEYSIHSIVKNYLICNLIHFCLDSLNDDMYSATI